MTNICTNNWILYGQVSTVRDKNCWLWQWCDTPVYDVTDESHILWKCPRNADISIAVTSITMWREDYIDSAFIIPTHWTQSALFLMRCSSDAEVDRRTAHRWHGRSLQNSPLQAKRIRSLMLTPLTDIMISITTAVVNDTTRVSLLEVLYAFSYFSNETNLFVEITISSHIDSLSHSLSTYLPLLLLLHHIFYT